MSMTDAKRAIYEMLEHGPMTAEKASLYTRVINAMIAAKLVRRREDGGVELVAPGLGAPIPRGTVPPPPAEITPELVTVSVRLPADVVAALDEMGEAHRSDAVRKVLGGALGGKSGTRRRAAS